VNASRLPRRCHTSNFSDDRDAANLVFDRWNEALAQRATILRTSPRGQEIFREWIDEGFQKEVDDAWKPEKQQEIRQLIESMQAASAERERPRESGSARRGGRAPCVEDRPQASAPSA